MDLTPALYGLDLQEARSLVQSEGFPAYRGNQLLKWLYQNHIRSLEEASDLPRALLKQLGDKRCLAALTHDSGESPGAGESAKYLFRTRDGRFLESVLIRQRGRRTVCVSTQLGCKVGCVFCASGKGKFGRNLTAGEIVEQVAWIERHIQARVSNIVFMGMGEPLDNFDATMKALDILQAPWGFAVGARRITVSTSGITPKIVEFVRRSEGRVRLSVSLHAAEQGKRTDLVPINKKYTLSELVRALSRIHRELKREITFEYTLIGDVNDTKGDAEAVAQIAKPLRAKVNIIPYNPIREMNFRSPSNKKIEAFQGHLEKKGVRVTVRQTAGREIDAACGQLRLDRETGGAGGA